MLSVLGVVQDILFLNLFIWKINDFLSTLLDVECSSPKGFHPNEILKFVPNMVNSSEQFFLENILFWTDPKTKVIAMIGSPGTHTFSSSSLFLVFKSSNFLI